MSVRDPPGMLDGEVLRERAAHREAGDVRALDAEVVEHADRVGEQVVAGVARLAGRPVVEPPVSRWS